MPRLLLQCLIFLSAITVFAARDRSGQPIEQAGLDKLARGVSTEGEVRIVMGQPETVREEDDGTRVLEYPKGPEGVRTWMFTIDKYGKLKDYQQVLTQENFARVQAGMMQDDVRRLLGKPAHVAQFHRKNEEVWDWRYLDGTTTRTFHVHFDSRTGKVVQTTSSTLSLP